MAVSKRFICTFCKREVTHETGCPSLYLSEAGQALAGRAYFRGLQAGKFGQIRVESDPSYLLGYRQGLKGRFKERGFR